MKDIKIHAYGYMKTEDYARAIRQGNSRAVLSQKFDSMLQEAHITSSVEFDAAILKLKEDINLSISHSTAAVEVKYMDRYYFSVYIIKERFVMLITEFF